MDMINVKVNGVDVTAPKGTTILHFIVVLQQGLQ